MGHFRDVSDGFEGFLGGVFGKVFGYAAFGSDVARVFFGGEKDGALASWGVVGGWDFDESRIGREFTVVRVTDEDTSVACGIFSCKEYSTTVGGNENG